MSDDTSATTDRAEQSPSPAPRTRRPARSGDGAPRGNRSTWIAVAVVGVAVLALFAFIGYGVVTERLAAAKKYEQAKSIIESADSVVVQVDRVVRAKVTEPNLAKDAQAAAVRVPAARDDLASALDLLDQGQSDRTDDEQEQAVLLRATAAARLDMLEQADKILPYNVQAATALPQAVAGWSAVIAADKLSDQAVASYNKLTKPGVTTSSQLNKQAATKLAAAKTAFEAAEKAFPEADFEAYLAYVATRTTLNALSKKSDAAWLKGDVRGANSVIATYNAQDKKAVEQAKLLPATPEAAVAGAYDAAVGVATDLYYAARSAATKADDALREF